MVGIGEHCSALLLLSLLLEYLALGDIPQFGVSVLIGCLLNGYLEEDVDAGK